MKKTMKPGDLFNKHMKMKKKSEFAPAALPKKKAKIKKKMSAMGVTKSAGHASPKGYAMSVKVKAKKGKKMC